MRDSSWMLAATGTSALLNFVQIFVVTRGLGSARYGELALIIGFATLVRQLVGVRIWEWAMKEFAVAYTKKDPAHAAEVVKVGYVVGAAVNAISFVLVLAFAGFAARRIVHDESTTSLVAAYGLVLLVNWSYDTSFAILRVTGRFKFLAVQQLAASVLRVILLGGAVLVWKRLDTTVGAYVAIEVAVSLWLMIAADNVFARELGGRWWRLARGSRVLGVRDVGKLMAIGSLVDTLKLAVGRLDLMVLGWYSTSDVVGNYQAAANFLDQLNRIAQPVTMVAFSDLAKLGAEGKGRDLLRVVGKLTLLGLVVTVPLGAALSLGAPLWCRIVYGAGYPGAPAILAILGWSIVWQMSMWMQPAFVSIGKASWGLEVSLILTPLKLGLLFVLVPALGGEGLAMANLAYFLAFVLATPFYLARMRKVIG
jgi:O-antigen/teichoic acid export membrane protein